MMTTTVKAGLIGERISKSLTPAMHVKEDASQGLSYRYDLIDTAQDSAELATLLDRAEADGFSGVNVTHPFKQEAVPLCDTLSDTATLWGQ